MKKNMQKAAILFSGRNDNSAAMLRHLKQHRELFWSMKTPIKSEALTFPLNALLHVKGDRVRFKMVIDRIKPFKAADFKDPSKKPLEWRKEWRGGRISYRITLVVSKVSGFDCEATDLFRINGKKVKRPPQGYIKIVMPATK